MCFVLRRDSWLAVLAWDGRRRPTCAFCSRFVLLCWTEGACRAPTSYGTSMASSAQAGRPMLKRQLSRLKTKHMLRLAGDQSIYYTVRHELLELAESIAYWFRKVVSDFTLPGSHCAGSHKLLEQIITRQNFKVTSLQAGRPVGFCVIFLLRTKKYWFRACLNRLEYLVWHTVAIWFRRYIPLWLRIWADLKVNLGLLFNLSSPVLKKDALRGSTDTVDQA